MLSFPSSLKNKIFSKFFFQPIALQNSQKELSVPVLSAPSPCWLWKQPFLWCCWIQWSILIIQCILLHLQGPLLISHSCCLPLVSRVSHICFLPPSLYLLNCFEFEALHLSELQTLSRAVTGSLFSSYITSRMPDSVSTLTTSTPEISAVLSTYLIYLPTPLNSNRELQFDVANVSFKFIYPLQLKWKLSEITDFANILQCLELCLITKYWIFF